VTLALGVMRMAKKRAIVRKLIGECGATQLDVVLIVWGAQVWRLLVAARMSV
jgi:hypothetical protein